MPVSKRLRYEILRRDGNTCRYCGRTAPDVPLRIDHVTPVALGGSDDPTNLVTACEDCNSGKSSTNPDAPLVADVANDALRWSQAREAAAQQMLSDLSRRQELRRRFKAEWDRWTFGGRTVDLPDGWERSVENFLAAGLPLEVLLDCVPRAMGTSRVKLDGMFRYMCGIAWRKVRELQDMVAAEVGELPSEPSKPNPYEQAIRLLYGLPSYFDDPVVRGLDAQAFDEHHAEDEDESGQPVDYGHWPADLKALVYALMSEMDEGRVALAVIRQLFKILPEEEQVRWVAKAEEGFAKAGEDFNSDDLYRYALVLHLRDLYPHEDVTEDVWS